MAMQDYHMVVMGGGPAGSIFALEAARHGYRVALLEAGAKGRDKACGGGLMADAVALLKNLGLFEGLAPHLRAAAGLRPFAPNGASVDLDGTFYVTRRPLFDAALQNAAAEAGAELYRETRAVALERDARGARVRAIGPDGAANFEAAVAVLATGGAPQGVQHLDGDARRAPRGYAMRRFLAFARGHGVDRLHLWFDKALLPGYGWAFPVSDTILNVGVGSAPAETGRPPQLYQLERRFAADNPLAGRLYRTAASVGEAAGAPLRTGLCGAPFSGERLLVIGEAAGSTYALSGEGIGKAMETARHAFHAADAALGQGTASAAALGTYDRVLETRLRHLFDGYDRAQAWLSRPGFLNALARSARRNDGVRRTLEDVLAERQPPDAVLSPGGFLKSFVLGG